MRAVVRGQIRTAATERNPKRAARYNHSLTPDKWFLQSLKRLEHLVSWAKVGVSIEYRPKRLRIPISRNHPPSDIPKSLSPVAPCVAAFYSKLGVRFHRCRPTLRRGVSRHVH